VSSEWPEDDVEFNLSEAVRHLINQRLDEVIEHAAADSRTGHEVADRLSDLIDLLIERRLWIESAAEDRDYPGNIAKARSPIASWH